MNRLLALSITALLFADLRVATAQAVNQPSTLVTAFPAEAKPLSPAMLIKLVTGKVFVLKPATGPEIRLEYRDEWAYLNTGSRSDHGRWRADGSAICVEWSRLPPGCSEMRIAGDTLYTVRASNGEVLAVHPK